MEVTEFQLKSKVRLLSCVRLFVTPWTVAYQALLSVGFSRQEYWCGLPFPSPEDLPNPGIKLTSPALEVDSLLLSHKESRKWERNPKQRGYMCMHG